MGVIVVVLKDLVLGEAQVRARVFQGVQVFVPPRRR